MNAYKRLPAYGREIRSALDAGLRPSFGGGGFVVTTRWDYARPYARLVCLPEVPVDQWDLSFLYGCEVIVLVPECDRDIGAQLAARLNEANAALTVLAVAPEDLV